MKEIRFARNEARCLLDQIRGDTNAKHQVWMGTAAPTELKVYGVRVPQLRKIARAWNRSHSQVSHGDLVALVEILWNGESREERGLATLLLEHHKHRVPDLDQAHFDRWRRGLDNWESTDGLGWTLALWVLTDSDTTLDYLGILTADENVWSRRLALVALVRISRERIGFTDPTLQLVDQVKEERRPMITKAVSWVLRELVKSDRERLVAYLEENQSILASRVVREARNKLRTGLKSGEAGSPQASRVTPNADLFLQSHATESSLRLFFPSCTARAVVQSRSWGVSYASPEVIPPRECP